MNSSPADFFGGYFAINFFLSVIVAWVANSRGRSTVSFFFLSLVFSFLVGILVVLAMPVVTKPLPARVLTVCPFCKEEINAEAIVCKHCGRDVEPDQAAIEDDADQKVFESAREAVRQNEVQLIRGIAVIIFGIVPLLIAIGGRGASFIDYVPWIFAAAMFIFGGRSIYLAIRWRRQGQ